MCDKRTELGNCMAIALNQSKLSFTEWLQKITLNELFIPDHLTIYCLSRFLNVYMLVYTKDFSWSTLLNQFKMSEEELYDICNSFTTKVKKYWKEHVQNHENKLQYSCPQCGKKFQYRQQVSRHKVQEHK